MKVAINTCFGGFGLSNEAFQELLKRKGVEWELVRTGTTMGFLRESYYVKGHANEEAYYISDYDYYDDRTDPDLIAVIEQFGEKVNGFAASLKIVEIPDDVEWYVEEYDGREWIAEKHRTWE